MFTDTELVVDLKILGQIEGKQEVLLMLSPKELEFPVLL